MGKRRAAPDRCTEDRWFHNSCGGSFSIGRPGPQSRKRARARSTSLVIGLASHHRGYAGTSRDRKSTRLNSSHGYISYAVFCLKKKKLLIQDPFLPTIPFRFAALDIRV